MERQSSAARRYRIFVRNRAGAMQVSSAERQDASVLDTQVAFVCLFAPGFAGAVTERFQVAHLDAGRRMLHHHRGEPGTRDSAPVPMRRIVYDAILFNTACWVVAHNHPSGDPQPSRADLAITRRLVDMARAIDIVLLDHLIFAGDRIFSFRATGML